MANNPIAIDAADLKYYDIQIKKYIDNKDAEIKASLSDLSDIDSRLDNIAEKTSAHEATLIAHREELDDIEAQLITLNRDVADLRVNIENKLDESAMEYLATKEYVDQAILNAELNDKEIDLTNYYTKSEVDSKIPSLVGYATEDYVKAKIAEAELNDEEVDLSSYYTKAETDQAISSAIENIPEIDLSEYAKKSEIPEAEIFIIDFNSPNFTDALEAYNSGKLLILTNAAPDTSSYAVMNYVRDDMITFTKFLTSRSEAYGSFNTYYLHNDNTWEISSEVRLNKVEANVSDTPISDLSTIRIGKEVYKIPSIENLATKADIDDINSRIDSLPEIPTKMSQLENDANYATEQYVLDHVNTQIETEVENQVTEVVQTQVKDEVARQLATNTTIQYGEF